MTNDQLPMTNDKYHKKMIPPGSYVMYSGSRYKLTSSTTNGWHTLENLTRKVRTSQIQVCELSAASDAAINATSVAAPIIDKNFDFMTYFRKSLNEIDKIPCGGDRRAKPIIKLIDTIFQYIRINADIADKLRKDMFFLDIVDKKLDELLEDVENKNDFKKWYSRAKAEIKYLKTVAIIRKFDLSLRTNDNDNKDDCSICMCPLKRIGQITLSCGHHFHLDCISEWSCHKNSCPLCRTQLKI
jgi:hypothetical protein